jgi:serine/threonine protein kinase
MPKDLFDSWKKIANDFDKDESLTFEDYVKKNPIDESNEFDNINASLSNLIQSAFDESDIQEVLDSKYKILNKLESGGQSDVYLAERNDGVYREKVVIKFISSKNQYEVLYQQFLSEMQLLADLKHPGVVPIIDGSIKKGKHGEALPWIVLEHIDGQHIDDYCRNQNLSLHEIIHLVIKICDTLVFIHQHDVLHKDLKPSNILVKTINGKPYPVLIDFGIAQDKNNNDALTFATLGYSSPEQVNQKTIDVRADIYSLGVILAQLLSADNFDLKQFHENKRSFLKVSNIPKELQQIINECVRENPNKRYISITELRMDLNHWLWGYPLSINSHKLSHVLSKLISRNKIASIVSLFVLIAALALGFKYTQDIKSLQLQTLKEKNSSEKLMNFMLDDLYEGLIQIGRIDLLQSVVSQSFVHLAEQNLETLDSRGLLQSAKAYINAARVFDQLEESAKALEAFNNAEELINTIPVNNPNQISKDILTVELLVNKAQVSSTSGQEQGTEKTLLKAITLAESLVNQQHGFEQDYYLEAHLELAYHYMEYSKINEAKSIIEKALNICESNLKSNPLSAPWLYHYSQTYQAKSWFEFDYGDLENGISALKQAINNANQAVEFDPGDLRKQNNIRILHNQLSFFYLEKGDMYSAETNIQQALELGKELKLKAPANREFNRELAYSYSTATEILLQLGRQQDAKENISKGLKISKENYEKDSSNFSLANDYAIDLILSAKLSTDDINQLAYHENIQNALSILQPVHQSEPNNHYYKHTLLVVYLYLNQLEKAQTLFAQMQEAELIDSQLEQILIQKNLQSWLKK